MTELRLDRDYACELDDHDPLRSFRSLFHLPQTAGDDDVYFVGNSLGLQPQSAAASLQQVLDQWRRLAVHGHFDGDPAWLDLPAQLSKQMCPIVGATAAEVVVMNTLSVNLHCMLATFYQPTNRRNEILIEAHAFPSDHQVVASHLQLRNQPPEALQLLPVDKETGLLRTEDILEAIVQRRDSLAMVLLPGVQYYSGQVLDMQAITKVARENDVVIGFDLAHAVGNIPLELHAWAPDFACWCTYKYLNGGPGALGGCFIAERHATNTSLPRLAGWWGHERASRFQMRPEFQPEKNALGWQLSNPPILSMATLPASLQIFEQAGGMVPLREKSLGLTAYLRQLLEAICGDAVQVLTPDIPSQHGCQLSLEVRGGSGVGQAVFEYLRYQHVHTDWRFPNVIRAAPVPLYNSYEDVWRFVQTMRAGLVAASNSPGSC